MTTDINKTVPGEIGIFQAMIASGPVIIQKRDGILKVLLVKHGDRPVKKLKWKFCGGKVLAKSDLRANAIREAIEEIGQEPVLGQALEPMILWNEVPETGSEKPQAIILIHFLATIKGEPKAGEQVLAMAWFDIHYLPPDCAPNVKPVIAGYLKQIQ